ncbi:hypothetical protein [Mycolicibacterium aubagnense]|uniref:Uncharacterized protein n=1 Tax=Mycolicibacterium aubagnense TaxID=319707 RepID=A0ABN5Z1S9_9MYCO|nr:hypothetical protein [Mycolicibacterium aubagnense]WGI31604.1 hypothetical protein QDT91_20575 [Mycolicibacterium aubagnense]BBX86934.1 hypothetical protein MAUB_48070 [Mycolicibacterium aubagnense]
MVRHRANRVHGQHRLVYIGGIFAIVGALAGGWLGGRYTENAAREQIQGSAHQSTVQFLLTQKQAAYTKLIADAMAVGQPTAEYSYEFASSSVEDLKSVEFRKRQLDVYDDMRQIRADYVAVELISLDAPHVVAAAYNVWLSHGQLVTNIDSLYLAFFSGQLSDVDRKRAYELPADRSRDAEAALDRFIDLAQEDLRKMQS